MRNHEILFRFRVHQLVSGFIFLLLLQSSMSQCPSGNFQNMDGECQDCTECNGPDYDNCTVCSGALTLTKEGSCAKWCTLFSTRVGNVCVRSVKDQGLQNAQVVRHLSMYTKGLLVWRPVQMVATLDTVDVRIVTLPVPLVQGDNNLAVSLAKNPFSFSEDAVSKIVFLGLSKSTTHAKVFHSLHSVCNQECGLCEGSISNCATCKDSSKFIQEGQCVDQCSAGFFQTQDKKCEACPQNCDECQNETTCLRCSDGFFFHNGECIAQCPPSTFTDLQTKTCKDCPPQCNSCDANLSCLNCRGGLGVNNGQCVVCASHQFLNPLTNICEGNCDFTLECSTSCESCSGSFDKCLSCPSSSPFLLNSRCEPSCPSYTVASEGICKSCPDQCQECNQIGQCLSCKDALLQEGTCVTVCAQGYYEWEGTCRRCVGQIAQIASFSQKDAIVKSCPAIPYSRSSEPGYYDYLQRKYETIKQSDNPLFLSQELLAVTTKVLLASVDKSFVHKQQNFTIAKQSPSERELSLNLGNASLTQVKLSMEQNLKLDGVLIALWTNGFFEFEEETPMSPVISLQFVINGEVQNFKTEISHPINLDFSYSEQPPESVNLLSWEERSLSWKQSSFESSHTDSNNLTFAINRGGVYRLQNAYEQPVKSTLSLHYSIPAYAMILLILSSLFDCAVVCRHRGQFYPHRRIKLTRNKCIQLYSFSLLYNLPLLNICCYRSLKMHAIYRALWFSNMLSVVLTAIVCLIHTDAELSPDPVANRLIFACILGVCFIPHSLLHRCMVEWKVMHREAASTDTVQSLHKPSEWRLFEMSTTERQCTSPKSSKRHRKITFQDLKGEEVANGLGIATFFLFTLLIHGVATLFAYIWKDELADQVESILLSFALAISVGLVYALIKEAIASIVSLHCRSSKCMQLVFVDVLTKMVTVHQNPTVNCGIVTVSCSERKT